MFIMTCYTNSGLSDSLSKKPGKRVKQGRVFFSAGGMLESTISRLQYVRPLMKKKKKIQSILIVTKL